LLILNGALYKSLGARTVIQSKMTGVPVKADDTPLKAKKPWFGRRIISSLQYRNYRLLWYGSVSEHFGQHMETMAMAWLLKELTGSPYYLGLFGVCRVAPLFFFALIGGVVADRVDRRKLLMSCFMASAFISLALLILIRSGVIAPWHILVAAALGAAITGFNHPARGAIIPNVTPKNELMNAIALDTISVRTASVVAAPIAGLLITLFGTTPLFGARAAGMVLAYQWLRMVKVPPTPEGGKKKAPWKSLTEGLRYTKTNGLVMALVCLFALREFQNEMIQVFLPFFADDILNSGAMGFGYLNGANGVGALIGLFGIASLGNFRYKGWLIIGFGASAGLMLIAFSLSNWLILSVVLLAASGCAATVFENVNRTVLQQTIPDEFRGRVMSLREAVRGLFGPWVAYGLGLGGEYIGVAATGALLGALFVAIICFVAVMLPALRKQ